MNCPKCGSADLEVKTEVAYLSHTSHKIENGKVKGFKKSDIANPQLFETRIFILCSECQYETDNTNYIHGSDFDNKFVEDITLQVSDLVFKHSHKRKYKRKK